MVEVDSSDLLVRTYSEQKKMNKTATWVRFLQPIISALFVQHRQGMFLGGQLLDHWTTDWILEEQVYGEAQARLYN